MKRLALLFDLDGTLIDSIGLLLQSMQFAFGEREHRPTVAAWTAGIGVPLRTQLAQWATSDADVEHLLTGYRTFQNLHLERLTTAYPGVLDTLAWIRSRGHATALVTSKGFGMTERSLRQVELETAFDVIVTAESTERHKPLADPVWYALERLDMAVGDALFVGDSTHDMFAGRAAGVKTAAATWGPFSREDLSAASPDYWLEEMGGLCRIIGLLGG
jgi:pyrophosphatase PpaX